MKKKETAPINTEIIAAVTEIIEPAISDLGYELVEVQYRREPVGLVLRVYIYHEDGIGIDDCARVSHEIEHLLEVEDLIEYSYHLEVSSPGLDRPLKTERDFARALGEKVRVTTREPIEGKNVWQGVIKESFADRVSLTLEKGDLEIPFDLIAKAKLIIKF